MAEALMAAPDIGDRLPVPEVAKAWDEPRRWTEITRWQWEQEEHINVLEARVGAAAAEHISRRAGAKKCRALILTDSQVTLGAMSKGRSSARRLNAMVRRVAAIGLSHNLKFYWRYIRSHRNPADGPSRGRPIGAKDKACPVGNPLLWWKLPEEFRKTDG